MNTKAIGIHYVEISSGDVYDPQGEIIQPKVHKGCRHIIRNRVRVPVSKLPKMSEDERERFREIFC